MAVGNSINEQTTGICGFSGTAFVGSPATIHCVQVGGSTSSTLTSITNGTTGQVLTAQTGADPIWATAGGGTFVNQVRTSTSAATVLATDVNSASAFPNTQGTQIMSASITPAASGDVLVFTGNVNLSVNSTGTAGPLLVYVGLFKTGTTNAIWSTCVHFDTSTATPSQLFFTANVPISYYQSAGGTSSQTFTIRAGAGTQNGYTGTTTSTLNTIGSGGGAIPSPLCTFFITEYTA